MLINSTTASKTAELLLNINAIKLQANNPFTWASGWKSPIYCDNRIVLSYPDVRAFLSQTMANYIQHHYKNVDVIAGVATGAIGIGMLVAHTLNLPFVYVRPEPKNHGRQNQIEGYLEAEQNVVVIEDLISTGNSSLNAVAALKKNNLNILGMIAIFTYGFETAIDNFKKSGITLNTISDYKTLLEVAQKTSLINKTDSTYLAEWRKNPSQWNAEKPKL